MVRQSKLGRFAGAVLSLVVASSSISTVSAAEATVVQKACCAKMHHDCGAAVITQKCCAPDGSRTVALAPDTSQSRQRAIVAVGPPFDPALSTVACAFRAHSSPLRSPRTPTYLSDSVFRI